MNESSLARSSVTREDRDATLMETMSKQDMERVARFIDEQVGIQLPLSKKTLVEGRLRKRMQVKGFVSFSEYLDYTLDKFEGQEERFQLIDVITTNKTNFFREPKHFEYLIDTVLPERLEMIYGNESRDGLRPLQVWSAGCSTGEEAYTLAMVLNEAKESNLRFHFQITATDISHSCLKQAMRGVYPEIKIEPIREALRKKYLLRSRNPRDRMVKIGPELRNMIRFDICNLMDRTFSVKESMDVIFCRNVMIYFNEKTKNELVNKFEKQLLPGGYLFVGHSESLSGLDTKLKQVAPMVYKK